MNYAQIILGIKELTIIPDADLKHRIKFTIKIL